MCMGAIQELAKHNQTINTNITSLQEQVTTITNTNNNLSQLLTTLQATLATLQNQVNSM